MLIPIFSAGLLESAVNDPAKRELFAYFNLWDHMDEFARGVVDTRRLVYYLSATVFFLFLDDRVALGQEGDAVSGPGGPRGHLRGRRSSSASALLVGDQLPLGTATGCAATGPRPASTRSRRRRGRSWPA